ncbi:hypothetical protein [Sphingomonas sp.]|uniref:hypothetical protein n=1 Tax=Sphingomonas sp. TaxID=28214 RepID=UPI0031DEE1FD
MKISLPAVVPNEGARRLAYYLTTDKPQELARFARKIEASESTVERLIRGEIRPGEELARAIYLATGGAVWSRFWSCQPEGGWFDRPISRVAA